MKLDDELIYPTSFEKDKDEVRYTFVSEGKKNITKLLVFTLIDEHDSKPIYNVGLVDLLGGKANSTNNMGDDKVHSNNGDAFKVFTTLGFIIEDFFEKYPIAILYVTGSDEDEDFVTTCRATCNRKCKEACKNRGKRMRGYLSMIQRNLSRINNDFQLRGRLATGEHFEEYRIGEEYTELLAQKKP